MEELLLEIKKMNKLLVQLLIKDMEKNEQVNMLVKSGYKYKDIGEILDISENTVKVHTFNKRKKLKK